jgi:hypothetical protein
MQSIEFIVRALPGASDEMLARYDCACGCKPNAEYQRGSEETGYEHCCCGNVHFVGQNAKAHLEQYLARRKEQGEDSDVGGYTVYETAVTAPWGDSVPVAYALPEIPRPH